MYKRLMLILLIFPVGVVAATSEPPGLNRVVAYAGSWRTVMHHMDSLYSKAGDESHLLRNDCWRSASFYACDQIVDGEPKALLVFLYDAKSDHYSSYAIPVDGAPDVRPGELVIVDDTWTFPWDATEHGRVVHFRVVNVWRSPDRIDFRQEYSVDGMHWTLMARGHDQRIKAGA